MTATEVLRDSENAALSNNQIVSNVSGKKLRTKGTGRLKGFTAAGFLTAIIVVFAVLFGSGSLVPSAISERLIEETDVQYADAVESKKIVFQQALMNGELPDNTTEILKDNGVLVGYTKDGGFVEGNKADGELVLKMGDEIISAKDFISKVSTDTKLYNAFNSATYARAAYYYDESAEKIFKEEIGTSRNNFVDGVEFEEVMKNKMKQGSDITVNTVSSIQNEDGEYELVESGSAASSSSDNFVALVSAQNTANTGAEATLNAANALTVADTTSKEQRSSLFYALIMEPISQMKAEDGNNALNEMMNYLTDVHETKVVNVKTGEIETIKGSALDSPSLYAVLSGEKVDTEAVQNYSSERILKTVENQLNSKSEDAIKGTVASTEKGVRGSIGRLLESGVESASSAILDLVQPTVSKSLEKNSYEDIKGIDAGEFLVDGAVNVGKRLAKASGATAGDSDAVTKYARLNSEILAMDAMVDRMNRSPFDVTSKNTFLGSIVYDMAISLRKTSGSSVFAKSATIFSNTGKAISALAGVTYADETDGYLTTFGDCETYGMIGAVGSAQCAEIATFDPSTLNDPFNDEGFKSFVESNTTLSGDTRTINDGSVLADFILYNDERKTPLGVTDGGILESINSGSSSISFVSDIVAMIRNFFGVSDSNKRIATGEAFVNSSSNETWSTYKYAQRYVSLARATAALKQYANNSTAYNNITYFEGSRNPVVAFLDEYYARH